MSIIPFLNSVQLVELKRENELQKMQIAVLQCQVRQLKSERDANNRARLEAIGKLAITLDELKSTEGFNDR